MFDNPKAFRLIVTFFVKFEAKIVQFICSEGNLKGPFQEKRP